MEVIHKASKREKVKNLGNMFLTSFDSSLATSNVYGDIPELLLS